MGLVPKFIPRTRGILFYFLPRGEERHRKYSVQVCRYFSLLPPPGPVLPPPTLCLALLPRLLSLPGLQVQREKEERT